MEGRKEDAEISGALVFIFGCFGKLMRTCFEVLDFDSLRMLLLMVVYDTLFLVLSKAKPCF
jgi:hypothetical protein